MVPKPVAASSSRGVRRDAARELVERVERKELDAGGVVDARAGHAGEHRFHHPVGAAVAVVIGVPQQFAVLPQQPVVAAPRIHADAFEPVPFRTDSIERPLHVEPETEHVPVTWSRVRGPVRWKSGRPRAGRARRTGGVRRWRGHFPRRDRKPGTGHPCGGIRAYAADGPGRQSVSSRRRYFTIWNARNAAPGRATGACGDRLRQKKVNDGDRRSFAL